MKIGIIGSSGFIGGNLYEFLRQNHSFKIFKFASHSKYKKKWINQIISEIKKKKPNLVINCSADQNLNLKQKNIFNQLSSNLFSNIAFIDECLKNKKFKGYISFGTKWELGDSKNKQPLNFYATTKKANDIFYEYFSSNKIALISLKIFDTYGPFDKRKKLFNDLLENYKKNKVLKITPGKQFLDYVHIKDICNLILMIIIDIKSKKLKGFNSYTVSSKKPIRLTDFINLLKQTLNKNLRTKIGKKYRTNESINRINKIFNYPGWKIKMNFKKEVKEIFDES